MNRGITGSRIPDSNHGFWLGGERRREQIRLAKGNDWMHGGKERFLEAMLDELSRSWVRAGSFLGIEDERIIVPPGALKDAYSGSTFEIHPRIFLGCDDDGEAYDTVALLVAAIPIGLSKWSILRAREVSIPMRLDMLWLRDEALTVWMAVDGGHPASAAEDAAYACLVLDQVMVRAGVIERLSEPDPAVEPWDPAEVLEEFGLGDGFAERQAVGFRREYTEPHWQLLASFALPYNLEVVREAGVLDAVAREASMMSFGFGRFVERRWFFGGMIVRALLKRGYSSDQVAYIVCHDDDLMDRPSDRVEAAELCAMIEVSAFEPESWEDWGAYTATKTGSLLGFL